MKPPICVICHQQFGPGEGGLLSFRLTAKEAQANKRFEEPGFVGHPEGTEWFCPEHYPQAAKLTHLTLAEAIRQISGSENITGQKP